MKKINNPVAKYGLKLNKYAIHADRKHRLLNTRQRKHKNPWEEE